MMFQYIHSPINSTMSTHVCTVNFAHCISFQMEQEEWMQIYSGRFLLIISTMELAVNMRKLGKYVNEVEIQTFR